MPDIYFSEGESQACGLRIGRTGVLRAFEPDALSAEIADLRLDVCRLKVDMNDTELYRRLERLCMPMEYYSILVKQYIELGQSHIDHVPGLRFELYRSEQAGLLRSMLTDILGSNTATYYNNSLYAALFDQQQLNEGFIRYYLGFDHDRNPDKYLFIAFDGETPVGFVCTDVYGDHAEPVMFGVVPDRRSRNHAIEIVRFAQHSAATILGCRTLSTNTVILNARSLNTTLQTGMKITGTIANVILYPLLSLGLETGTQIHSDAAGLVPALLEASGAAGVNRDWILSRVRSSLPAGLEAGPFFVTRPIQRPDQVLMLARQEAGAGQLYLTLERPS